MKIDPVKTFIEDITFRVIKPGRGYPHILNRLDLKMGHIIESLNTVLPAGPPTPMLPALNEIPRMSTVAIGAIINYCVSQSPPGQSYVNIGVWNGYSLLAGMIDNPFRRCIGIDNFSEFGGPKEAFMERFFKLKSPGFHFFYEEPYQIYFEEIHRGPIGFYFYDGPHTYNDQLWGLQIAEPFLAEDAIILVDDANEPQVSAATRKFMEDSDFCYEIIADKRTAGNCHPTFWNGILVLRRG